MWKPIPKALSQGMRERSYASYFLTSSFSWNVLLPGSMPVLYVKKILSSTPIATPLGFATPLWEEISPSQSLPSMKNQTKGSFPVSPHSPSYPCHTKKDLLVCSPYSSIFYHLAAQTTSNIVLLFNWILVLPLIVMNSKWLELSQILPAELCYKKPCF